MSKNQFNPVAVRLFVRRDSPELSTLTGRQIPTSPEDLLAAWMESRASAAMMVRLFQITRLSNQLMPTASAPGDASIPLAKSSPPFGLILDTKSSAKGKRLTNERRTHLHVRLCAEKGTHSRGGGLGRRRRRRRRRLPKYTPHTSR